MKPQDYGSPTKYRPPANWYQKLNRLGARVVGLGLAPIGVMTLQVRGRVSGRTQKTPVLVTPHEGADYLVSLAGDSQWVRNVRAADGHAALKRGRTQDVTLIEITVPERAPIIAEYLRQGRERSGEKAADDQARFYFGLEPKPSLEEIQAVADRYPVFRVEYSP